MTAKLSRTGWLAILAIGICAFASCRKATPVAEIHSTASTKAAATPLLQPAADDWPAWRGLKGDGLASGTAPTKWSATEGVIWKTPIKGEGHSSPVIWGQQIFVATAEPGKQVISLLCLERATGKLAWECPLHEGGWMHIHQKNTHASATAACDGQYVYYPAMVKGGLWVSAVTLDGKLAWQKEAGPFQSMHGYGSSPVLFENLVIVAGDSNGPGWLAALDRKSGEIVWRVQRGTAASFGTPAVATVAGKPQLLMASQQQVVSYNPKAGEKLWQAEGPADVCANTLAWNDELVFASGGYPQPCVMAIKADGSGEVVWRQKYKCYVPSLLVDQERLIVPLDQGIVRCLDARTGDSLWFTRLGGDITSSPVLAGGNIYVTDEKGTTFVLKSGPKLEQIAANELGERCYSTPTICGGRIYLRTWTQLYCLGPAD